MIVNSIDTGLNRELPTAQGLWCQFIGKARILTDGRGVGKALKYQILMILQHNRHRPEARTVLRGADCRRFVPKSMSIFGTAPNLTDRRRLEMH